MLLKTKQNILRFLLEAIFDITELMVYALI